MVVGGPQDLPPSLRAWCPDGPDLVLPEHQVCVNFLDAPHGLLGTRRDPTSPADHAYFGAAGWHLVTLRAARSPADAARGTDPRSAEVVQFSAEDVPAAVANISRFLSDLRSDQPGRGAAPAP